MHTLSRAAVCTLLACCSLVAHAADATSAPTLEGAVRAQWLGTGASTQGPMAWANSLQPDIVPAAGDGLTISTELRTALHAGWFPLAATVTLQQQVLQGRAVHSRGVVNELFATHSAGAWQFSAGKKIVGWDVGYGFRPNDVVQQEERRTLISSTPQGRPLLMSEHFTADAAWSFVWVNPTRAGDAVRGDEPALAARYYKRLGALDLHAFGRLGEHSGASAGAAMAWVATDELEVHGSLRVLQGYDARQAKGVNGANPGVLLSRSPWQSAAMNGTSQALIGTTWTSQQQTSIYIEAWWDGTALSDAQWDTWNARNRALRAMGVSGQASTSPQAPPLVAVAGNLAWQLDALGAAASIRRANVFVRWTTQFDAWQPALDLLVTPADGGRVVTASLAWQGDRVQCAGGVRLYGGPSQAVLAQLPASQTVYANVVWSF